MVAVHADGGVHARLPHIRITDDDIVLASEDGIVVFTEDDTYAIELRPDRFTAPSMRLVNTREQMRFTSAGTMRFNN